MDLVSLYFRSVIVSADIVGNNRCIMCGATGDVFCQSHFLFFQENELFPDKHWWFWYYSGKARDVVLDIKKHRRFRVAYRIGQYMGQMLIQKNLDNLFGYISYVPHHKYEIVKNMFSFPYLLAMGLSDIINKPIVHLFEKQRPHSQHVLTASERKNSLKNVYNISRNVPKVVGPILIVDDIITTGSTLESLKGLALGFGIDEIYTITLAKTPKWSDVV